MEPRKPPAVQAGLAGKELLAVIVIVVAVAGLAMTLAITCSQQVAGPSSDDDYGQVDPGQSGLDGDAFGEVIAIPMSIGAPMDGGAWGEVVSNFNGTDIPAGRYIWFSAVMKYRGPKDGPVTIHVRNAVIQFSQDGIDHGVHVPNTMMTLDDAYGMASATYNPITDTWEITCPFNLSGNRLLSAVVFPVTTDLEGGINPVTWGGEFFASSPDVCVEWKWSAAVYTDFTTDLSAIQVKVSDSPSGDMYGNSHHAGAPENYLEYVVGGARGGGGSNFTGSYSGTKKTCDLPPAPPGGWPGGEFIPDGDE